MNEANFSYVHSDSEGLFFITNYRAPKYRLVKILFDDFSMAEVIPESNLTLKEASFVNDMIIADYIDINMHSKIIFLTEQGEGIDLTIPENITGTLSDFQSIDEKKIMFSSSSFTQPDRYFNFNTETAEVIQIWEEEIPGFDPSEYQEVSACLLYTSPSPRDRQKSRMPSSA